MKVGIMPPHGSSTFGRFSASLLGMATTASAEQRTFGSLWRTSGVGRVLPSAVQHGEVRFQGPMPDL